MAQKESKYVIYAREILFRDAEELTVFIDSHEEYVTIVTKEGTHQFSVSLMKKIMRSPEYVGKTWEEIRPYIIG